ncbi:cache domain-containing protein [Bdellovibrio svalbardensis]|uniref:Cache domain-containing protein n=1 Tax=Bdellovibrio svalbardensis TaxID=2972972 RepID=A0ABT6DKP0_9BACT|nr:cache domain-containing protein [Bdellovibrio svalbardensis]MDG0817082.1 cache domain-containing protein [Bdellovibrio svalbardensis]
MKKYFVFLTGTLLSVGAFAADNCTASKKTAVCTEDSVKERVEWACKVVETKGKAGLPEINAMRFECCGEPNYVWVQDMKPTMIIHPIKTELNGQDLSTKADPKGKKLFVEFVNAVKKTPSGAWVDYEWTKFGEPAATPKKSWVKKCKASDTKEDWIVGSGTWL